jgi:hypothetical protein
MGRCTAVQKGTQQENPPTSPPCVADVGVLNGTADRSALRDDVGGPPWVRSGVPNVDTEQRGKAR